MRTSQANYPDILVQVHSYYSQKCCSHFARLAQTSLTPEHIHEHRLHRTWAGLRSFAYRRICQEHPGRTPVGRRPDPAAGHTGRGAKSGSLKARSPLWVSPATFGITFCKLRLTRVYIYIYIYIYIYSPTPLGVNHACEGCFRV